MKDILFRGKPKNKANYQLFSQTWQLNCKDGFVYGSLIVGDGKVYICVSALCCANSLVNNGITTMIEVIPETVGQYTGLTDKNGKKIFEGDIIHSFYANCPKNEHIEKVSFIDGTFSAEAARGGFFSRISGQGSPRHMPWDKSVYMIECEVIGNIHDNPELLKGGAE